MMYIIRQNGKVHAMHPLGEGMLCWQAVQPDAEYLGTMPVLTPTPGHCEHCARLSAPITITY